MSSRSSSLAALSLLTLLGPLVSINFANDRTKAEQLVAEALHRQVYGLHEDRSRLLAAATQADTNFAPARWHQGFVRVGGGWSHINEAPSIIGTSYSLAAYRKLRDETEDTLQGNMTLADWCRDRRMTDQERAHLSRVLDFDSNNADARERLGFQLSNGQWVHTSELQQAAEDLVNWQQSLDDWDKTIIALRRELTHSNANRRSRAAAKVRAIDSVSAIPAFETLLSSQNQTLAKLVVETVANMPEQEAIESLVRHAVLSPWAEVRDDASMLLKSRPRESYVPLLLAQLYTAVESRTFVAPANGRLVYQHAFAREGQKQREFLLLNSVYRRRAVPGGNGQETLSRAMADSFATFVRLEQSAQQQNVQTQQLNERITRVLNIATQQQLPANPQAWWQWWDQQNDVVQQGDKQVQRQQRTRQVVMQDQAPPQFVSLGSQEGGTPRRQSGECFVAGTIVWTASGKLPIEDIRVGDTVLAQDIRTGELAYKPVLRTTVRSPELLVKLRLQNETLETSGGHLFWVTGKGWAQSRELRAGQTLHSVEGSVPLLAVKPGTKAQTYNLVVADFNTYVVGECRVLSHDVTERLPTRVIVPGLPAN